MQTATSLREACRKQEVMTGDCSCDLTTCYTFMLYKMALTFKSVDNNLWGDHSNAVLSCGAVCYAVQVGSNFCQDFCGWKPMVWPFKWTLLSSTFLRYCLWRCHKPFLPTESVDEILQCDHLVTFPVVLFHGTKCFVLFVCFFRFNVWYVRPWGAKWVTQLFFFHNVNN